MLSLDLGIDLSLPNYTELMYPEKVKSDERTGKEIIDSLIEKLRR